MLELTLREISKLLPVEAFALSPALCKLTTDDVAKQAVFVGNRQVEIGQLFHVQRQDGEAEHLKLVGDLSAFRNVGSEMSSGLLTIDGNVGDFLGSEMQAGDIRVSGNAGDCAGAGMGGGRIRVQGHVGSYLGAAFAGAKQGMHGGEIIVEGSAQHYVGQRMRRGLITIHGGCGDFAGSNMLAGTILIHGAHGHSYGASMVRGTIALLNADHSERWRLAGFVESGEFEPTFLRLYLRHVQGNQLAAPSLAGKHCRRFRGDRLGLGKGEIIAIGE